MASPCRRPLLIPCNTLVIYRRRGGSEFSNFQNHFFIARAPSRFGPNPRSYTDSFHPIKDLGPELGSNSFEISKMTFSEGTTICFFPTWVTLFCEICHFLKFFCPIFGSRSWIGITFKWRVLTRRERFLGLYDF